jgi:hypothetical protein
MLLYCCAIIIPLPLPPKPPGVHVSCQDAQEGCPCCCTVSFGDSRKLLPLSGIKLSNFILHHHYHDHLLDISFLNVYKCVHLHQAFKSSPHYCTSQVFSEVLDAV